MAHTPTNWQDFPSTSTPITAAEMARIDGDATQAYNASDCFAGRTFAWTITETVTANEGIASSGKLKISNDTSDISSVVGVIVRCSRTSNNITTKWIVPIVDYTIEYVSGFGTYVTFPATTYFYVGDIVTAQVYMPVAISPPKTQAQYDAMPSHDPNTLYVIVG